MDERKLQIVADEATKPFGMVLGAALIAVSILLGVPLLALAGMGLFAGLVAFGSYPRIKGLSKGLSWHLWTREAESLPQGVREQVGLILREGKGVQSMAKGLDLGEDFFEVDLQAMMEDVMTIGRQSRTLRDYLSEWNLQELQRRLERSREGSEERKALQEQVKVISNLFDRQKGLKEQLSTLHAQLGAVRASLLQTSLNQDQIADVQIELASVRDTAHAISESYDQVTLGLSQSQ